MGDQPVESGQPPENTETATLTMSDQPVENGQPPENIETASLTATTNGTITTSATTEPFKPRPKIKKPEYRHIHRKPLPLETHPLPAFHPTNPISFVRLGYTYLSQLLAPPSSHPQDLFIGYFSPETRSVHITDPKHARALWEMGFFGKGLLSRSELSWLEREKAILKEKRAGGGGTAEEATRARRERRRLFKLERALAEAQKIERQRLVEEGKLDPSVLEQSDTKSDDPELTVAALAMAIATPIPDTPTTIPTNTISLIEDDEEEDMQITNQEHLQLTMEEAFFLTYALGVLAIHHPIPLSPSHLLPLFTNHTFFPPRSAAHPPAPDDPFLLSYTVYHHFRSLGWVVRPGTKFSVDYLLYLRGPVFSHAEFAIKILPAYTDPFWTTEAGLAARRVKEEEEGGKDWWWLHCVNRVQGQVLKSLVVVYVDVPAPMAVEGDGKGGVGDVGALLRGYTVREVVVRRWTMNRSRD